MRYNEECFVMNIKDAKEQIKNAIIAYFSKDEFGNYVIPIERQRPVFLIGAPGIGKTAIMEQIAQELNVGLVSYSMTHHTRQSALGLPFIAKEMYDGSEYNVSEYTMSEIIAAVYKLRKETGHQEGILFLDEVNCVSETLAPSMLQFLQYKVFGTHQIPKGWIVVTAGNPPEYNKSVREYDIVTWDRLKRVDVEPDYEVWKEYAYKKGIHGSILTFLEIKKNYFYVVETTVERKSFVTARGWEDLSEMIRLYEQNNIVVDIKLVSQYLQNPHVAKEFAVYYDLYNKYKSDYQISDILSGSASDSIKSRAKSSKFDERLSLLGLLIDSVNADMRNAVETDNAILENLRVLKKVKSDLSTDDKEYVEVLHGYLESERALLVSGEKANSIDYETKYAYNYVIRFIEETLVSLNRSGNVQNNADAFKRIKSVYDETVSQHKEDNISIKRKLSNLFEFVDEVFQDGQEMLILVTELTVRYYCAKFISKFGCDEYFKHNQDLLFYERKQELLQEISELEL